MRQSGFSLCKETRRPADRASCAARPKRSGWRGTKTSSAVGNASRTPLKASITGPSSPSWVLPAVNTGRSVPQARRRESPSSSSPGGRLTSNFRLPVTRHPVFFRADFNHSRRVLFALCRDDGNLAKRLGGQSSEAQVRPDRMFGNTGIYHDDGNPARMRLVVEIGPDFGLHDDQQTRLDAVKKTPHGPGQVQWRIHVADSFRKKRTDTVRAGRRDGGHAQGSSWKQCSKFPDQGRWRHLPRPSKRHARRSPRPIRRVKKSEALRPSFQVIPVAQPAITPGTKAPTVSPGRPGGNNTCASGSRVYHRRLDRCPATATMNPPGDT